MAILLKGCKPDKFESHYSEPIIQILLNVNLSLNQTVNLSLNQTLPTFLLCLRQTWITQLILAVFL